jgi:lipoprotein-anchoring transpeptidase ErfK/SrfK
MIRTIFIYLLVLVLGIGFFVSMIIWGIPSLQESEIILPSLSATNAQIASNSNDKALLESEIGKLQTKLDKYTPSGAYIVVNTTENHFYLYKGKVLLRHGVCSTGKNEKLIIDGNKKTYTFYTPYGVRTIQSKQKDPVWAKPDWAFKEDGLPVPPPGDPSRFESGTLGKYKLVLGDGYMIHGTIWKRFMGMSVTHGCIRLLDDDLEAVYNTLEIGSKVYIY